MTTQTETAIKEFLTTTTAFKYSPIESDVEFLTKIIEELDVSWAAGEMCTTDGRKCLVGAGAHFSGIDYPQLHEMLRLFNEYTDYSEEYTLGDEISMEVDERIVASDDIEYEVGSRLFDLLGLEIRDNHNNKYDKTSRVTSLNDTAENYRDDLRPKLIEALGRAAAREAGVDGL